jgi:hypothetical protein
MKSKDLEEGTISVLEYTHRKTKKNLSQVVIVSAEI